MEWSDEAAEWLGPSYNILLDNVTDGKIGEKNAECIFRKLGSKVYTKFTNARKGDFGRDIFKVGLSAWYCEECENLSKEEAVRTIMTTLRDPDIGEFWQT